jgi:hypothetical protein
MELNRVEILLFDLHLVPSLPAKAALKAPFEFLADRTAYEQFQQGQAAVDSVHWRVLPLRRHLKRGHFWSNYLAIDGQRSCWRLQAPVRCKPRDLGLAMQDPVRFSRVSSEVFLFPAGWSSNLVLTVSGKIRLQGLQALLSRLLTGSSFQLPAPDGAMQPRRLAEVWQELRRRLKNDLYLDAKSPDLLVRPRHLVMGISASPPLPPYGPSSAGAVTSLAQSDQADLHSALLGQTIDVAEMIRRKNDQVKEHQFTHVQMQRDDFALCYFQHGVLAALSHTASRSVSSMRCLLSNIRDCSMMTYAWLALTDRWSELGASAETLDLLASAQRVLKTMPDYYHGRFCRALYRNHGRLRRRGFAPEPADGADTGGA